MARFGWAAQWLCTAAIVAACSSGPVRPMGGVSTQFTVSGAVARPGVYDLAALQALPPATVTVGSNVYRGVGLWDFLNKVVGLKGEPGAKNPSLPMYVVATGSDGYRVVIALAEIDPAFGNQNDLIAYSVAGVGLGASGFARLVVPNDGKAGRHVANLVGLDVVLVPAAR